MNHRLSQKIRKKMVKTGDKSECHLCQKYAKEGNLKLVLFKPSLVEFVSFTFQGPSSSLFFLFEEKQVLWQQLCWSLLDSTSHWWQSISRSSLWSRKPLLFYLFWSGVVDTAANAWFNCCITSVRSSHCWELYYLHTVYLSIGLYVI